MSPEPEPLTAGPVSAAYVPLPVLPFVSAEIETGLPSILVIVAAAETPTAGMSDAARSSPRLSPMIGRRPRREPDPAMMRFLPLSGHIGRALVRIECERRRAPRPGPPGGHRTASCYLTSYRSIGLHGLFALAVVGLAMERT